MRVRALSWVWLGLVALSPLAAVGDDTSRARELAALRAEVEQIASEVEQVRDDRRGRLRSLDVQRTELQARIRQEEVRIEELQRLVDRHREVLEADSVAGEVLAPVLAEALVGLRESIQQGLPYRVDERLAEVDKLERQLAVGTLAPQRASTRVWQLVEDEIRLTRENVLDRQVVVFDGEERLVDVGRLGMVMMVFRTDDGRIGRVTGGPGAWTFAPYTRAADTRAVQGLFEALDKQVRVGFFELPNDIPEGT